MNFEYDNLYDGNQDSFQNHTKPLDEIMAMAIHKRLLELHTVLPAEITKVRSNAFVDAQPLLKRRFTDNTVIEMPIIQEVPVVHPRGADYWLKLPIAVGDKGMLLFSERSLELWKLKGTKIDPEDTRTHDYSDAIFVPGLYSKVNIVEGAADDMVLHNGEAEIFLQKAGAFLIKGETQELLDLISQTAQTLADSAQATSDLANAVVTLSGLVIGGAGAGAAATAAGVAATLAKSTADTIKGNVDGLTGEE